MAAGVFGAVGYDMVRLVEPLPDVNPDPLDLPDAVMMRPSIVAVFDSIGQEIVLATPVRPVRPVRRSGLRGGKSALGGNRGGPAPAPARRA